MLREVAERDHLPDYHVIVEDEMVIFRNREVWKAKPDKSAVRFPVLDAETFHDARGVAPGYDVFYLEQEWRNWWFESGMPELGNPGKAFVAFCRSRYQRRPNP